MTDVNDLQEAMRTWKTAFGAMTDYFDNNDILDPVCLEHWTELEAAQDKKQAEVKQLVEFCRSRDRNGVTMAKNTFEYKGHTVEVISPKLPRRDGIWATP